MYIIYTYCIATLQLWRNPLKYKVAGLTRNYIISQTCTRPLTLNVCKASRKWHTSKSQPPFTCDCGVSSSGSRTLSVGGAPQAREVCVVPQEQCGVVTLCDLPGPPAAPPLFKKERNQKEKDQYKSYPPMTAPSAAAGRGQRVLDPGPTLPQKVTGGCPCCLATGQYPQLPKFLESEPTYENKALRSTLRAGSKPLGLGCVSSSAHWLSSRREWAGASICPAW